MARTFNQMAAEAMAQVEVISPAEAHRRLQEDPRTLVIDVRDAADVAGTGTVPGAINVSLGTLTYGADQEVPDSWRDPRLADRSRPVIVTCILGPLGAIGGKLLDDMGFEDVSILEGGVQGWLDAGYSTAPPA
jgi:rhodanese-related sulfurtransferase